MEAANISDAVSGSVVVSHFRRPSVSIVRIAGSPKRKLTAPVHPELVSIRKSPYTDIKHVPKPKLYNMALSVFSPPLLNSVPNSFVSSVRDDRG